MNKKHIYALCLSTLFVSTGVLGQEKDKKEKKEENIGTEVVNVVRAYDATISDAFKVREIPSFDNEAGVQKKPVKYTINSFPVASTFVPAKGEAAAVEKDARLKAFDNYLLFGAGRYVNLQGELFLSGKVNETDQIAGFARHFSSQGGVKGVELDDAFSNSSAEVTYRSQKETWNWNLDVGGKHQISNWYGLPTEEFTFQNAQLDGLDEQQIYKTVYVGGKAEFSNAPLTGVEFQYKRFWDSYESRENRFFIKPNIRTAIGSSDLNVGVVVDYVGTDYENFLLNSSTSYSHLNLGLEPSITFQDEDYSFKAGVGLYFNNGKVAGETDNSFYVYPQVKASFKLVHDILITYMGAEGGLKQNSYADFVNRNPFVSPDLMITPTSEQYDLYVGLKGKLDNSISYNVKGSIKSEDDKAFFRSNVINGQSSRNAYELGNSFGVLYGNLKTYNVFGELKFDFEENVSIGLYGEFNHYETDMKEAWNMPKSRFGADIHIDFSDSWFAGTDIYYVGERKDVFRSYDTANSTLLTEEVRNLDGFADLNVKVGYRPTANWTLFLEGNNLLNKNYEQWKGFRNQGIQVMGGAIYKFDF